jgi:hypothetical protein
MFLYCSATILYYSDFSHSPPVKVYDIDGWIDTSINPFIPDSPLDTFAITVM